MPKLLIYQCLRASMPGGIFIDIIMKKKYNNSVYADAVFGQRNRLRTACSRWLAGTKKLLSKRSSRLRPAEPCLLYVISTEVEKSNEISRLRFATLEMTTYTCHFD